MADLVFLTAYSDSKKFNSRLGPRDYFLIISTIYEGISSFLMIYLE